MRRLFSLLATAFVVVFVTAQEMKLTVSVPGTLHSLVGDGQNVEKLTLSGTVDDSDLRFIRSLPKLKRIDLRKLANKELGDSAFYGMRTLEYARLPKKLVRLGRSAFEGCVNLSSIQLSDYMESIPEQMLKDCTSLDKIDIYNSHIRSIEKGAFMNSSVRIIPLPQQLRSIGMAAFANCKRLEQIRIPKWVLEIGSLAFANCKMLRSIIVRTEIPPTCAPDAFDGLDMCTLTVIHPEQYRSLYPWSKINLDYNEYNGSELKTVR